MSRRVEVPVRGKDASELLVLSKEKMLSLNEAEMEKIQEQYQALGRNPTDIELETIAQTWSEHCKHKTFNSRIEYTEKDSGGKEKRKTYGNLFKETIVAATREIEKIKPGFMVSVFSDNAGIISFDDAYGIAFKVETHNHPSALEPYGGANTGLGGVIRDILGAGLGARPIANTDVFCFGMPDTAPSEIPPHLLHPKRIARGVRAGVRDYGNRMGIPTVNGAIWFEDRYLGNPLVFCGTLGIIPKGMENKTVSAGELIVAIGGRTGRDGIHGATFSSAELEEHTPSSPVQIGNPIEEKKVMDVLLRAREEGLYTAVTDCGAGGFSSAVGEMGAQTGAEVHLEKAPLKYKGLHPWEIWISEAQERMVFSVPKEKWERLKALCAEEEVEATHLGHFTDTGKLVLKYDQEVVGEMDMAFLHEGVPARSKAAVWEYQAVAEQAVDPPGDLTRELMEMLAMPNIASKETTIRQYDHEVLGGTVGKPLVGAENDGPADAAIVRPLLNSNRGVVISNGVNPWYGDVDPYWMAASTIDEAIRNAIAVGADFGQIALLDNFSWGNPEDPGKLAGMVRAAQGCHDFSVAFATPFVSGKDSLNNEYRMGGETRAIPGTLLVSAMGIIPDITQRVSMDAKEEGNAVYILGKTYAELGGSHYFKKRGGSSPRVPEVRVPEAREVFTKLSACIRTHRDCIAAIHDCSEGGLGVAAAEMAFSGDRGMSIDLSRVPGEEGMRADFTLFSESNSRFVVEVVKEKEKEFEAALEGCVMARIGEIIPERKFTVLENGNPIAEADIGELKKAWKGTLKW